MMYEKVTSKRKECKYLEEMNIGDYISCGVILLSNAYPYFYDIGVCDDSYITRKMVDSQSNIQGRIDFIKVDEGLLIADRPILKIISEAQLNYLYDCETPEYYPATRYDKIYSTTIFKNMGYDKISSISSADPESIKKSSYKHYPFLRKILKDHSYSYESGTNYIYQGISNSTGGWLQLKLDKIPFRIIKIGKYRYNKSEVDRKRTGIRKFSIKTSEDGVSFSEIYFGNNDIEKNEDIIIDFRSIIKANYLRIEFLPLNEENKDYRGYYYNIEYINIYNHINIYEPEVKFDFITGGIMYKDEFGNPSNSPTYIAGAYPIENEYDKYMSIASVWNNDNPKLNNTMITKETIGYEYLNNDSTSTAGYNILVRGRKENQNNSRDSHISFTNSYYRPVIRYKSLLQKDIYY